MLIRCLEGRHPSGVKKGALLTTRPSEGTPSYLHVVLAFNESKSGAQLCREVLEGNWSLVKNNWSELWRQISHEWDVAYEASSSKNTPGTKFEPRFGQIGYVLARPGGSLQWNDPTAPAARTRGGATQCRRGADADPAPKLDARGAQEGRLRRLAALVAPRLA